MSQTNHSFGPVAVAIVWRELYLKFTQEHRLNNNGRVWEIDTVESNSSNDVRGFPFVPFE